MAVSKVFGWKKVGIPCLLIFFFFWQGRPLPFVKKTKSVKDPVTKKYKEVLEILIDETAVKKEIEKRRRVRSRAPKSVEEMAAEAEKMRVKRRIRENIRRLNNDKDQLERVIEAIDDNDTERIFAEGKLVCGACGMVTKSVVLFWVVQMLVVSARSHEDEQALSGVSGEEQREQGVQARAADGADGSSRAVSATRL